jgi:hypothetical protein
MDPENRSDEDGSGVLEPEDSLDDRGVTDVLDEGWSPPERPWAVTGWGTTAREEAGGESLEARLARELRDDEVGDVRAGRLVPGEGPDGELYALDAGIDGGAASAEEAAVHLVGEQSGPDDD